MRKLNWQLWRSLGLLAIRAPSAPTDFQLLVRASLGNLLPVYGDSLFRQVPSTFAPLREVNVTPDYVLGPGDQLVVRIWGQVNFNAQLTVDRSGSVLSSPGRRDPRFRPAVCPSPATHS